jgi:transposase
VGAAVVMPWVSSEAMTIHLAEIGKQVSADAHAVLVCDGAGWHQTGQRLTVPDNVSLLRLPPYAPELNPIENVWEYLRGNQLSRRVWDGYDDIVQASCDAWNGLIADAARVTSITTRHWASVKT